MCILMRNGIRKWLDVEQSKKFRNFLHDMEGTKFIGIGGETINTADILGVFYPKTLEALWHEKRGDWQCSSCGKWLQRSESACSDCLRKKMYPNLKGYEESKKD